MTDTPSAQRKSNHPIQWASRPLPRDLYLNLLRASLATRELRFSQHAALRWLSAYPGDLEAALIYAKTLKQISNLSTAHQVVEGLCIADPEYLEAVEELYNLDNELQIRSEFPQAKSPNRSNSHSMFQYQNLSKAIPTWMYVLRSESPLPKSGEINLPPMTQVKPWGEDLREARKAIRNHNAVQAHQLILSSLGSDPIIPLAAVTHIKLLFIENEAPLPSRIKIAEHYHRVWPNCLAINIFLALWLIEIGQSDRAVDLLHETASRDVSGQVARRILGDQHQFISLWPTTLELSLDIPISGSVTQLMGWNQLTAGERIEDSINTAQQMNNQPLPAFLLSESSPEKLDSNTNEPLDSDEVEHTSDSLKTAKGLGDEELISLRNEIENLGNRMRRPGITQFDGRFPVYVVISNKKALITKYGASTTDLIIEEMRKLVSAVRNHQPARDNYTWGALLYLADAPEESGIPGLKIPRINDPWSLKLSIADLDQKLAKRGEMIGALLIVGGPEIIPFHHLPNPVDDPDDYVPSDNPYGTRDKNYFLPEWPVGRLPDGRGTDPGLLLNSLRRIQKDHQNHTAKLSWLQNLYVRFLQVFWRKNSANGKSIGYTAAVWRQASQAVFRPIGNPQSLLVSPPYGSDSETPILGRMSYYNLHGLIDAAEWYGQKDPIEQENQPDFPIALRPDHITLNGNQFQQRRKNSIKQNSHSPEVVFSEACYGALITGKSIEGSICLKFLAAGCKSFIGSTCMSYGSISPPLIAADMLGNTFWNYLREGFPTGEALRRAKFNLARQMHKRQGFLDGEDQKTLISFILYGDPLARIQTTNYKQKSISRLIDHPTSLNTVCDRGDCDQSGEKMLNESEIRTIKEFVANYLPGMSDAALNITKEHADCQSNGHLCPTGQLGRKGHPPRHSTRRVVTLSKQIPQSNHIFRQYARITLDEDGKLVKIVVSR